MAESAENDVTNASAGAGAKASSMSGSSQAAILLMALGEEEAANVLQHMEPDEVQRLGEAMGEIKGVTQEAISETLDHFIDQIKHQSSLGIGSREYFKTTLTRAIGKDKASSMLSQLKHQGNEKSLATLKWMDPRMIARLIANEHPQIIATIISHLTRTQGGEVLNLLPEHLHSDIILRISRLDKVHPAALSELDEVIQLAFANNSDIEVAGIGGMAAAGEILNAVSKQSEERVLEELQEIDPDLCTELRENMLIFENLLEIDDRGMQTLLRDVAGENLIVALKGASVEMQQKVFRNMSKRAADMLQDDLAARGPVKLSDMTAAQREILMTAKRLGEEGKIAIASKGDEYV